MPDTITKEDLARLVDLSLSNSNLISNDKIDEFKWKVNLNNVEIQIAIEHTSDQPSLSLYLVVMQLPAQNRAACIEELMSANFHIQSKYALFSEFILQVIDIQQTNSMSVESFVEVLNTYAHHVVLLRNDLYLKYYN